MKDLVSLESESGTCFVCLCEKRETVFLTHWAIDVHHLFNMTLYCCIISLAVVTFQIWLLMSEQCPARGVYRADDWDGFIPLMGVGARLWAVLGCGLLFIEAFRRRGGKKKKKPEVRFPLLFVGELMVRSWSPPSEEATINSATKKCWFKTCGCRLILLPHFST